MIRHLNDFSYKKYGSRAQNKDVQEIREETKLSEHLEVDGDTQPVYKTTSDVWLWPEEGMTVISVSRDGEEFRSYYLDQPICLCLNMYFYLSPQAKGTKAKINKWDLIKFESF